MSEQTFSLEERIAFWKAHGQRCFYDGDPLAFSDLEIDHLVPESYANLSEQERNEALSALNLPHDYDVRAYYNLVSSCKRCNSRKSSKTLRPQFIGLSLATTEPLAESIRKDVQAQIAGKTLSQVLRSIATSLDKGKFTSEALLDGLEEMGVTRARLALNGASVTHVLSGAEDAKTRLPENLILLNHKAAADIVGLSGVGRLLTKIASGDVQGDRVETDGRPTYIVRSDGMYIKYMVSGENLLIVSCHLT